ncbi:collagen-binding protein [Bacteroidales bacterium]|nr:collagen-binding protein [Bacteroidales bacterium]
MGCINFYAQESPRNDAGNNLTEQNPSNKKFSIGGSIKDAESGEYLIGVPIGIKELPSVGTASNEHGFYSLTLPSGNYTLTFRYLGYETIEKEISLTQNQSLNISLSTESVGLQEVVISARRRDENVSSVQAGLEKLDVQAISKLPVLMGERDLIKIIQLLPGVKSASEGSAGFYVRGGGADQNLILLDNALVYNASHLLGFFSTFNSDAIKDVSVYKGAMPAQYGERLSSVLDIIMNEGNNQDYQVSGGIGLISSKLNVEGPIQKGKSSFLISGRRTYADIVGKAAGVNAIKKSTLYFYDLNAKMNYIVSDKDRLFLSGYFGRDKLGADNLASIDWGNTTGTLRWNHIFNNRLFSNTSLIYSNYSYSVDISVATNFKVVSQIQDLNFKQEFQFFPNPNNSWRFGLSTTKHRVLPGDISGDIKLKDPIAHRFSWENGVYASNNWKISDKLNAIYGLRLSTFSVLGNGNFYNYGQNQEVLDTIYSKKNDFVKTYINPEPRLSLAYQFNEVSSVKAAYARTSQNMHLLSNSTMASPTDRWTPSSNYIKPEIANQVSLGYFRNFYDNLYEFSVESYYKDMQNQIDYKDGAETRSIDNIETELLFGKGRAYGIEFLLKKKSGRFNGWIGYTLSRSEKKIDKINDNKWYAAKQDRTHDISVVGMFDINSKWSLSAAWVYYTGNAITFPSGKYDIDGEAVMYYTERNGYRAPAYHRLDLGASCVLKKTKRFYSELAFSLFNAYGRENPYIIDFRTNKDNPDVTEAYQISLFKYVPSISWNFKF